MNLKDLIGLKIIDVAEGANSDEWTVTLENKVRLVFEVGGDVDKDVEPDEYCHQFTCDCCDCSPTITLDIQDYSGALND